ncbi:MAG: hypothetical protein RBR02_02705 [Desulfuromonadaceae bacterium]|nr:hypothetical protein [Desulfuromonadaceae bacterium]
MQVDNQTQAGSKSRCNFIIWAVALLLVGGDFILTPHAPLHHLPQFGIYMLVTLAGVGAALGLTLALGQLLRRREDYYAR